MFFYKAETTETAIKIIAAKRSIQDLMLCRSLEQRKMEKSIADKYYYEVQFISAGKKEIYKQ